jgi:hypothetical protein
MSNQRDYKLYVEMCEEFNGVPTLTKADFINMTERQKAAYQAYRKGCAASNVEPTLADFLLRSQKPKALAATAGR